MSALAPITIQALIDKAERPGMIAATELLGECLGAAAGGPAWPVRLQFRAPGAMIPLSLSPSAIVASMLPEVQVSAEPPRETTRRLHAYMSRLLERRSSVFLCTVFRYVRDRDRNGRVSPITERIRRLNRLAIDLSHDLGIAVIDIDRTFAHIGGQTLGTDYRLTGLQAAQAFGHATAWSLLSSYLGPGIDFGLQERARSILGNLNEIDGLLSRRLQRHRLGWTAARFVSPDWTSGGNVTPK